MNKKILTRDIRSGAFITIDRKPYIGKIEVVKPIQEKDKTNKFERGSIADRMDSENAGIVFLD